MVYKCTLSPEQQEQARKELNEDPQRRDQDIETIRTWIKKQPHLHIRTDDWFILRFLRGCKFSLERTKEKIDMHYTLKTALPEWFKDRDPQQEIIQKVLKTGAIVPLLGKDDKGRCVFLFRQAIIDPNVFHVDDTQRAFYMLFDLFYEENEDHSIAGLVMIGDMKGLTAAHMLQYPLPVMKKGTVLWQDGYPTRMKGMYYVNVPNTFDTIFNMFKGFLNKKNRERIRIFRSNSEEVFKSVPKKIMPTEYGGEAGTIQEITDHWLEKLNARRDWFKEDQKNYVIESRRPGKAKTGDDLFGLDGSFRKLNVD